MYYLTVEVHFNMNEPLLLLLRSCTHVHMPVLQYVRLRPLGQCVCVCVRACWCTSCVHVRVCLCVCVWRRQPASVRAGGVLCLLLAHLQAGQTGNTRPCCDTFFKTIKDVVGRVPLLLPCAATICSIHYLLASLSASRGGERY